MFDVFIFFWFVDGCAVIQVLVLVLMECRLVSCDHDWIEVEVEVEVEVEREREVWVMNSSASSMFAIFMIINEYEMYIIYIMVAL